MTLKDFIKPPIEGDRYYSREEILCHLNFFGRKLLVPGFRKEGEYRITDYLLAACTSRTVYVSAVVGVITLFYSIILYKSQHFSSSSFFLGLYERDDLGFAAYYSFLHSMVAGIAVIFLCIVHMVLLVAYANHKAVIIIDSEGYKKEGLHDQKHRKRLYLICISFGMVSAFGAFTIPAMIIDWFNLPQTVGDSPIFTALSYVIVVFCHWIAALLFFLSFIVFYGTHNNSNKKGHVK